MYAKHTNKTAHVMMVLFSMLIVSLAWSQTPEEKGFEIAARSDRSDRGFKDTIVELKMILRNKAGRESVRTLQIRTLEIPETASATWTGTHRPKRPNR